MSKSDLTVSGLAPAILFFVAGAFWVAVALLGGGVYLVWAAATSLASGALIIWMPLNRITNPFMAATCLFGLVLTIYQLYLGLTLIGTMFNTVAIYNTVPFAAFAIVYAYVLIFATPRQK